MKPAPSSAPMAQQPSTTASSGPASVGTEPPKARHPADWRTAAPGPDRTEAAVIAGALGQEELVELLRIPSPAPAGRGPLDTVVSLLQAIQGTLQREIEAVAMLRKEVIRLQQEQADTRHMVATLLEEVKKGLG
jgi:hypothetical protein